MVRRTWQVGPVKSTLLALGVTACACTLAVGTTAANPLPVRLPTPLHDAVNAGVAEAKALGVTAGIAVEDRASGAVVSSPNAHTPMLTASVVKVFIADDLLTRADQGTLTLTDANRTRLSLMIRSSDDDAADAFWAMGGTDQIISDIVARYHLTETHPPSDTWWDTTVSPDDMVKYYAAMLSGKDGTAPDVRNFIVGAMDAMTPFGTDGENQTFGFPTALASASPKGFKQGWMPLNDGTWVHNSTSIAGPGNRYIVVLFADQPGPHGEAPTLTAMTQIATAMFPHGLPSTPLPSKV